jgi:hypothetical protein
VFDIAICDVIDLAQNKKPILLENRLYEIQNFMEKAETTPTPRKPRSKFQQGFNPRQSYSKIKPSSRALHRMVYRAGRKALFLTG